ncbi:MAG TPA: hypothetical protein VHL57_03620, partial [Flavobacteriales bacterium]|nr:hypothetical protein [Flavobacteriales bacterium]
RAQVAGAGVMPGHVEVYGAGCGTVERAERMRDTLRELWPGARIDVWTDLLGAARGLCGRTPGLVLILGTGMNAGHYDGAGIDRQLASLGFILGDEGSGADIGKHLLADLFHQRIPEELRPRLFPDGPALPEVVQRLYREPGAQRYLAGFTGRLDASLHEPYVQHLLRSRFAALAELIAGTFSAEQRAQVHATGSVAHAFEPLLREALAAQGMVLSAVTRDPLPGLVRYHRPRP